MSFFDFLEKVREKPEGERKIIALVITAVFVVIIISFWIMSGSFFVTDSQVVSNNTETSGDSSTVASPVESFVSMFSKIGDEFSKLKTDLDNEIQQFQVATSSEEQ